MASGRARQAPIRLAQLIYCVAGSSGLIVSLAACTPAASLHGESITSEAGVLYSVSAVSASDAWAVGTHDTSAHAVKPLVLHWNGIRWTRAAIPTSGSADLLGVGVLSRSDAWAVGAYPSCAGPATTAPVLHWNGTGWRQVASSIPGGTSGSWLSGVSVLSRSDAWAVGMYRACSRTPTALILHWNGSSWTRAASPSPGGADGWTRLSGVSAVSRSDAWAVGSYRTGTGAEKTLALHWNGTHWAQVRSPNLGVELGPFSGVNAVSRSDAWAVWAYHTGTGADKTLMLHWNGTSWIQVASPNPGVRGSAVTSVSAISPSDAWAVGGSRTGAGESKTLVLHWNGTHWTQVSSPSPGGPVGGNCVVGCSGGSWLSAVTGLSPSDAWAVGTYLTSIGPKTLVLHWNGTRWTRS
jgi:hypothetical protein